MSSPIMAIKFIEKSNIDIKGNVANIVSKALIIAFEEGRSSKVNTFDPVTYDNFMVKMKDRFSRDGLIKTGEAWEIAKGVGGYVTICNMFRVAMQQMEDDGTAFKIRNGSWVIQKK